MLKSDNRLPETYLFIICHFKCWNWKAILLWV